VCLARGATDRSPSPLLLHPRVTHVQYVWQVTKEVLSDFVDSMQSKDLLTSVIGAGRCDVMRCDTTARLLRFVLAPIYDPT
jgi:hypothetical protein